MDTAAPLDWQIRSRSLKLDRALVMGILNVTPDSFSDGGQWAATDAAVAHALQLVEEGADILDVGGESTRPGAEPVPVDEELRRVVPVIAELVKRTNVPISVDTMKPGVAKASLEAGAEIVNDVTGLADPAMVEIVRTTGAGAVVMHMQGDPQTMQLDPHYVDVVREVGEYFELRLQKLADAGIGLERVVLDPGIGFGKKSAHNWALIAGLAEFGRFGRPICLGVSRKGFLGKDREPRDRLIAGLAVACYGITTGSVHIIRTHDVAATRDAVEALQ